VPLYSSLLTPESKCDIKTNRPWIRFQFVDHRIANFGAIPKNLGSDLLKEWVYARLATPDVMLQRVRSESN
jgi:hypothetical protein